MSILSFKKVDEDQVEKSIRDDIKVLGEAARSCINSNEFQYYRKKFIVIRENIVNQIADYRPKEDDVDLSRYGLKMFLWTEKLRHLGSLIQEVENDAKKGISRKEEQKHGKNA